METGRCEARARLVRTTSAAAGLANVVRCARHIRSEPMVCSGHNMSVGRERRCGKTAQVQPVSQYTSALYPGDFVSLSLHDRGRTSSNRRLVEADRAGSIFADHFAAAGAPRSTVGRSVERAPNWDTFLRAEGRTDRDRRNGDRSAARHDVSCRSWRAAHGARAYFRQNAQTFHPHRAWRQSFGRTFPLRSDQGAYHFPRTVSAIRAWFTFSFLEDLLVWRLLKRQSAQIVGTQLTGDLQMAEEHKTHRGAPDAQDKLESSRTHARKAAEDLRSAAGAVANEYRDKAEQAWDDARDRVRTFQDDAEQYVRENPTKAVVTALGIGFVLGMIFRR